VCVCVILGVCACVFVLYLFFVFLSVMLVLLHFMRNKLNITHVPAASTRSGSQPG